MLIALPYLNNDCYSSGIGDISQPKRVAMATAVRTLRDVVTASVNAQHAKQGLDELRELAKKELGVDAAEVT